MLLTQLSIPKTNSLPTHVIDCGKSEAYYYHLLSGETGRIRHSDLLTLNLPGITNGSVLVIEEAHLRAREEYSLAQPFTYEQLVELQKLANQLGVTLLQFPQKCTPKARTLLGIDEKTDANDVKAIANYLTAYPPALNTLKSFQPTTLHEYQARHVHRWHDRELLTKDVNAARNREYLGDAVAGWIDANIQDIYEVLTAKERELLELRYVNKGRVTERLTFNNNRLYTVVATLMRPNGSLRLRSDVGKVPFWKYAKDVYFAMTPYHMRGGVVASNVKHHWRRAASDFRKLSKDSPLLPEELAQFASARAEFDKCLRSIWRKLRSKVISHASNQIQNKPSQKTI